MIGAKPPLAAVLRLVWASLTVRLGRHVITALSVMLAVAFLVSIAGECVATRTVALGDASERRAADQVQALRAAIVRPRDAQALLDQCVRDAAGTQRWLMQLMSIEPPAIDAGTARQAQALVRWLATLPSGRAWLVTHSDQHTAWVLGLDAPGRLEALAAAQRELAGVRPPLDAQALAAFAARLPALRLALEHCAEAERLRLARLMAEGGVEACLLRLENQPHLSTDALTPFALILPDWANDDRPALQAQLRCERLRSAAQAVLAERARRDPAAIDMSAIDDWPSLLRTMQTAVVQGRAIIAVLKTRDAAGVLTAERLAQALTGDAAVRQSVVTVLDAALVDTELSQASLWQGRVLPNEVARLMGQDSAALAPRTRTRLNRLLLGVAFPGLSQPLAPVPASIDQIDDDSAAGESGRVALRQVLGADDAAAAVAEQTRRERRAHLAAQFIARGGDPFRPDARRIALAALALVVCAVGVINALLMAIHERFREIATMKCLGARDGFIVRAVLWEAALVGLAGALLGAALGIVMVVMQASGRYGQAFWSAVAYDQLFLVAVGGIAIGVGLALIGALIPARIAARMPPVAALRVEA